jgi:hypothetical protein
LAKNKNMTLGQNAIRIVVPLVTLFLCILASGCRDVATIWSSEAKSPDGNWMALAYTEQHGGPGTAGIVSIVQLQRASGNRDKIEILELWQNSPSISLKLNWLTASQLEITYTEAVSVDFQAVKCAGIDIAVKRIQSSQAAAKP